MYINPLLFFIQPWVISITPIVRFKKTNICKDYDLLKSQGSSTLDLKTQVSCFQNQ